MTKILESASKNYKLRKLYWMFPGYFFILLSIIILLIPDNLNDLTKKIGIVSCIIVGIWFLIMGSLAHKEVFRK
ncbi:MAG: hypothetical protein WC755_05490 [Candidatus Woesearchaeota archaeon]|jgi:hypothetical protein